MKSVHKAVVLLAGAVLLTGLAVSSFRTFNQIKDATNARQHTFGVLQSAHETLAELIDAETGVRGYLLTDDEVFLEPYRAARNTIPVQLEKLRTRTSIPAAQQHLNELAPLIDAKLAHLAQTVELGKKFDRAAAVANVSSARGKPLMDLIRTEMRGFIRIEKDALAKHEAEDQSRMGRLLMLITTASLLLLGCALGFAYLINRKTHLALQISEEKFAVTLNSIGDAVMSTDAQGCVALLNPRAEELTGWKQEEALGRPVDEIFRIINQDSRRPATLPIAETLAHGTKQGLANHTLLIARDGRERAIADSCAPIRARTGQVVGAVLVFRDVTVEYATQQALRASEDRSRRIFEESSIGVVTVGKDLRFIRTNSAFQRMLGYSEEELQLLTFKDITQPEHLRQDAEQIQNLLEGKIQVYQTEKRYTRKDGQLVWGNLKITTHRNTKGELEYFLGMVEDISERKLAEESLRKAGPLQNAIFNSANFSSIATDAKGVIQIFNVGAERMLGYAAVDVMNKITPADISDPQEVIARAQALSVELGTPITPGFEALVFKASRGIEDIYELTYIRKDGSRFPAVVSVTALRDEQNAIIGYLLIGTDNTARKQAEEALLKAGALQNAIFNSANFSSIATDAKGVIQIFNVGAERMLGYAAVDVMNKITPADISDPQEVIARAQALSVELATPITPGFEALVFKASRGIEDIYELTYIRKDGSRFPAVVSVTALRDAQNAIIGYLLIGTDNTARKQIEADQKQLAQRLRDYQFYTRSLFESNIDALMTTDPAGIITDVNKQMETLTGCTRDELIGAPFKNYFTDSDLAERSIQLVLSEKKVTNYELTVRALDNKETVVSLNATTFYDRNRKLQGVFAAARDVTERKRLDQVLQEKNIELESARSVAERANLAKSDFLSSMSHELRSPLNAILGFAQLMESASPMPSGAQKESIDQILQAGWHLLKLINEILDLARIESGKVSLSQEPVALAEIMPECQAMMEPQAQLRGIQMTFPVFSEEAPFYVKADRTRLKQIVINLLSNAIKYNKSCGAVVVTCTVSVAERIRISVADTGAGLPPEKLAQLFQPFNRLGQEGGGIAGTGIGLVVTKRLAELMEGVIGVESKVGVGSVFWCELVAAEMPHLVIPVGAAEVSISPPPSKPNRVQQTLLYIEDNPANMKLIEQIIERHPDIQLLTEVTAQHGIELARATVPEVILMDINLPGLSGLDAFKILRADPVTAHIPIVALSANAMPQDIAKCLELGFFSYLTKPIKVNELMETLRVALEYARKGDA